MHLAHTTTYKLLATSQKLPQNNPSCGSNSPELLLLCVSHTQGSPPPVREQQSTAPAKKLYWCWLLSYQQPRCWGGLSKQCWRCTDIAVATLTPDSLGANHTLSTTPSTHNRAR